MMKTKELLNINMRNGLLMALVGLTLAAILTAAGCEQQQANYTYNKEVVVWPFFDLHRTEGINEQDGSKWQKEKGDCCILSSWEKEKVYDKEGFLTYRKEKSMFFPFTAESVEENEKSIKKEGSVLLFPYKTYKDKTVSPK